MSKQLSCRALQKGDLRDPSQSDWKVHGRKLVPAGRKLILADLSWVRLGGPSERPLSHGLAVRA